MIKVRYEGMFEQHLTSPFHVGLPPTVYPGQVVEVPDDFAVFLLQKPGWEDATGEDVTDPAIAADLAAQRRP